MQLFQIVYFLAVAEARSFTRGAQRANVVQSAVSAGIRQLERELGSELFDRKARSIQLTPAGEALMPRARDIVAAVRDARDAVNSVRGAVQGTVVLGTLAHHGPIDLVRILHNMHDRYPDVSVKLRQTMRGTRTSLEDVRSGALDLALVSIPTGSAAGLDLRQLHCEPINFVCAQGHRLARRPEIALADSADEPFIDFPDGWGNRAAVDSAFGAAGLSRTIHTEVVSFAMALNLVREDLGVAFLPQSALAGVTGVCSSVVSDPQLQWRIQLASSASRTASLAEQVLVEELTGTNGKESESHRV